MKKEETNNNNNDEGMLVQTIEPNENGVTFVEVSPDNPVTRIQSYCMSCGEEGWTTFLLTSVPHFRELIISSFHCPYCNEKNNSIQYGGSIQEKGVRYTFNVKSKEDLNRQVVKSDYASIYIPEIQLEIPSDTQKGCLNTIEGIIMQTHDSLNHLQPLRKIQDPENHAKIADFIKILKKCMNGDTPFTLILDDYSGNSFIENPNYPKEDPELTITNYERSNEQDMLLGLDPAVERLRKEKELEAQNKALEEKANQEKERSNNANDRLVDKDLKGEFIRLPGQDASSIQTGDNLSALQKALNNNELDDRIIVFEVPCSACPSMGEQKMVTLNIPYFKDIVLMAYSCANCGYKNSEIKTGGAISEKGKRLILTVKNQIDLSRDVLKSESAILCIPEIDLEVEYGSMGGKFTTVEGILNAIKNDLKKNMIIGDSSTDSTKDKYDNFIKSIHKFLKVEEPFTVIINDPVANSYIQNICWPEPDPQLIIEEYDRTPEQNEDLGLNDINTENYLDEVDNPEQVYGKKEENNNNNNDTSPHGSLGKKE